MSLGLVLGVCVSPISNFTASCFALCSILCSVGNGSANVPLLVPSGARGQLARSFPAVSVD
eukprot:12929607-Prorocentrum_lima.AAC.1